VNLWGGWSNREQTQAWTENTIVPVYSTTKGVAALVMALLADRGELNYDAASASVWPAFGAHGKDKVTIRQTLAHQAGVPGFLEPIDPDLWLDPAACCEAIAGIAPLWPPGTASGYHPMTWGYIAGEIARRASGRSLGTVLREDICKRLGIDFQIGTPESDHARAAEMKKPTRGGDFGEITPPRKAAFFTKWAAPTRGSTKWRKIEIPAANGQGNALAVARLYEVYATGGMINGARVLSQEGFDALTRRVWKGDDLVLPFNVDWRAGIIGNSNRLYGPNLEAFGHSGNGGSMGMGDPVAGVSAGYVMNKQSHHIMGDPRALALINALYSCL
jgi:CubicO group peptidase (beta-lactamase class C family)